MREGKYEVNGLVTTKLAIMVEGLLANILWMSFRKARKGIRSVVYEVADHFMLDVLRKDVIYKKLGAHIMKGLDDDAATEGLPKRLMTLK